VCELWPYRVALKAYEDVKPTLTKLKQKGLQLIVVSNVSSSRNLRSYLTRLGLESYFDVLVGSGSVGYEKPNPEIFKLASKLSSTPFEKMMHVGDSYREDYLEAESVGIKAVLLDRKGIHKNKKCRKISQLTELFHLLF
jgi:putative hydrolase of the HAD superfamily